jgi:archaellum component FlaC
MTLTPDVTTKLDSLSSDDYKMVVMLIERLADKPSSILKAAREKYLQKNPMTMEEIDEEIQNYRSEKQQ